MNMLVLRTNSAKINRNYSYALYNTACIDCRNAYFTSFIYFLYFTLKATYWALIPAHCGSAPITDLAFGQRRSLGQVMSSTALYGMLAQLNLGS